ncbi:hypothetical protein KUCAC02_035017, partial [Chaenocephalus aceratus]
TRGPPTLISLWADSAFSSALILMWKMFFLRLVKNKSPSDSTGKHESPAGAELKAEDGEDLPEWNGHAAALRIRVIELSHPTIPHD